MTCHGMDLPFAYNVFFTASSKPPQLVRVRYNVERLLF